MAHRSRSPRRSPKLNFDRIKTAAGEAFTLAKDVTDGSVYIAQSVTGLSDVSPDPFVVSITMIDGTTHILRNSMDALENHTESPFLMQSTFKPLVYAMALEHLGVASVHRSVGSLGGLGYGAFEVLRDGRAANPLINSGALILLEKLSRQFTREDVARFCCTLGDQKLVESWDGHWFDEVAVKATEDDSVRNRGICCFLASRSPSENVDSFPKTDEAVENGVKMYCMADCLKTNTHHLSHIGAIFANGGCALQRDERLLSLETIRMVLSQMLSAGMYEASGDWSREMGIPAKSGVSGAIFCVVPSVCGIGIYSPRIDAEGNSVRGMRFVRELVRRLPELSVFGT